MAATVSSVVTRKRWRPMPARRVSWLEWETGQACEVGGGSWSCAPRATLEQLLRACGATETVYVVGLAAPAVVQSWATAPAPAGWFELGHYLDDTAPVARFECEGDGSSIRLACAAQWFGAGDYTPAQARDAWGIVEGIVGELFGGAQLVGTPATTGRELIARSIPDGVEWPVLAGEVQQLIRSTTGQGRAELFKPAGERVQGMVEMDMRLAYAAVAWGMPTGAPQLLDRFDGFTYNAQQRGRYEVAWRVPDGWTRPGILPAMREGGGWCWPHEPGDEATGWVDGAELRLALEHGWHVDIGRALVWPLEQPHDPLKRWAEKIVTASNDVERQGAHGRLELHTASAARAALRAIVLYTIGALHGSRHDVTRSVSIDDSEQVPADAIGQAIVGDRIVWRERQPARWPEMSHPEWSASIWARARCRLLEAPSGKRGVKVGALHLAPADVIGFRTDALYLANDPGWVDDGKAGRYRPKRHHGPFTVPHTLEQLDQLRGAGASPTHGIAAARAALAGAHLERRSA